MQAFVAVPNTNQDSKHRKILSQQQYVRTLLGAYSSTAAVVLRLWRILLPTLCGQHGQYPPRLFTVLNASIEEYLKLPK